MNVTATADFHYKDRFLTALPLFHVGALTPALCCVYVGCTQVILMRLRPQARLAADPDERITTTLLVPAMLQFMLAVYDPKLHDVEHAALDAVRRRAGAGDADQGVRRDRHRDPPGLRPHRELRPGVPDQAATTRSPAPARPAVPSSTPTCASSAPDGKDCAPGEPGEVLLRGPHIMVGYWNRPEATAETIVDGWLHTGDVGTIDEDGFVTIRDRIKDMLISGGENVYPAEVENVLLGHPAVVDAAVIGLPSPKWGEVPLAVVVAKKGATLDRRVLACCKGKLAPFKRPKRRCSSSRSRATPAARSSSACCASSIRTRCARRSEGVAKPVAGLRSSAGRPAPAGPCAPLRRVRLRIGGSPAVARSLRPAALAAPPPHRRRRRR